MGLRDLLVFIVVFGGLPFILRFPPIGILYWVWIGLMNPHRQAWGIAFDFPFALVVAVATLIGILFSSEPRRFKGGPAAWLLVGFMVWTWLTTSTALVPDAAVQMLERVVKIQLFTLLALLVLYKREHVFWLVTTVVLSIGYYGVKGGVFTVATGGENLVWGPVGSFVQDNNALATANVMSIPLWAFLYTVAPRRWMKVLIIICIALTAAAVLGSHSRGALLAIGAMSAFLWLKSRRKFQVAALLICLGASLFALMPTQWEERMSTISTYEQDASAQGRLSAWTMAYNLALDRPIVGGGFEPFTRSVYERYNPEFVKPQVAHSIYFQVLGEHGFVGLFLWGSFWFFTWRMCRQVISTANLDSDDAWAHSLARMVQVSLVGYFVGGAFLNLAYWDMPYYLMVLLAVTQYVLAGQRSREVEAIEVQTRAA